MRATLAISMLSVLGAFAVGSAVVPAPAAAVEAKAKNWQPPAGKIYAQALSDHIMSVHPELLSVTFHGTPPGTAGIYTMFAGSYPDRIGNPDDPDDIDVITKGITIIDPRWHRANDNPKKFVVQMPLRDASGANIGLLVLAYRTDSETSNNGTQELDFLGRAIALRDSLQPQISSFAVLFAPAIRP
jgi:hypothetical protein